MKNNNYTIFHCHTTYSVVDSTTQPEYYIERAKDIGMESIAFSEHGNCYNWIKKKQLCDKAGIKYIHAIEMYLTRSLEEKVRDNFHVILIAKNKKGVDEINELYSMSTDINHLYYNPRISFEEFFEMSDNIITSSACLGGVLNKLERDDPYYDRFVDRFDFLEVQAHIHPEQLRYNLELAALKGKKLIAGTDTHEISEYKSECRKIWMHGKGKKYADEDSFDLVFKTYDELVSAFDKQGVLSPEIYLQAIENTNVMADMVEDFELDYDFKYPDIYDNANELFYKVIYEKFEEFVNKGAIDEDRFDEYIDRIEEEFSTFTELGMESFMLFMGELMDWCISEDISYGYARGSAGGSLIAYLLNIIDVDPIVWNTVFSRFVNVDRVSLGDIDSDFAPADRKRVYNYVRERFSDDKSSYIATFTKLSVKSIVDVIGKSLDLSLDEVARIKKGYEGIDKQMGALGRLHEAGGIEDDEFEEKNEELQKQIDEYISKFDNIFYYYKGLKGSIAATGIHPCGMIGSPINIRDSIGLRYDKKNDIWISCCDMKNVDSMNYVKYDILSLKTLQVVRDSFVISGGKMPKSYKIDWEDQKVYEDMISSPVGLFQMESDSAFAYLKSFKPTSVRDITLLTAIIRPSCASFRDKIMNREFHYNADPRIDELLKDSYGYLVYQEQQISFLQKICGFTAGMADVVRRAIGKKDPVLLAEWLPKIEQGYIDNSSNDEEVARAECQEFMQIFIDAASYSFGYNHAIAYSMLTYMTAYQRYYQEIEFVTSYLNNASDDSDIINGTILARVKGIKINNPKFGKSIGEYSIQEGEIYKGIASVLNVSNECAMELKDLYDTKYSEDNGTYLEMISDAMALRTTNTLKLKTLVKIDFFSDYGKAKKLFRIFEAYEKYKGKKQLTKETALSGIKKIVEYHLNIESEGFYETAKLYKFNDQILLETIWTALRNEDFTRKEKVINQLSYLSYIQDNDLKSIKVGTVLYNKSKKDSYCISFIDGSSAWYELTDGLEDLSKGDMIIVGLEGKMKKGRGFQKVIQSYEKIKLHRNKRS